VHYADGAYRHQLLGHANNWIYSRFVALANYVLSRALAYGSQLRLARLGDTWFIGKSAVLGTFAHGDTMALGAMSAVLISGVPVAG